MASDEWVDVGGEAELLTGPSVREVRVGRAKVALVRRDDVPRRQGLLYAVIAALPASAWLGYRSLLPIEESYVASMSAQRVLDSFGGWLGLLSQPLNLLRGLAYAGQRCILSSHGAPGDPGTMQGVSAVRARAPGRAA